MLRLPLVSARRAAFTLIEILTATAIMVIIILVVLTIATQTFKAYDGAVASLTTTAESRSVLMPLQQDLESAIIRNDGNVWLQVEHPGEVGNISKGNAPKLMLFAPVPDRPKREGSNPERIPGDVCAVNIELAQRSPFDNPGELIQQIYGLYRAVVDARATFNFALPVIIGNAGSTGQEPLMFWRGSAEVIDIDGNRSNQSLTSWATGAQNFQASNVMSLSLVFWYYNTETKKMEALAHEDIASSIRTAYNQAGIDTKVTGYNTGLKVRAGQIIVDGNDEAPLPAILKSVDISTVILSPAGAKELRGLQQAEKSSKISKTRFDALMKEHGVSFSGSVRVYQ